MTIKLPTAKEVCDRILKINADLEFKDIPYDMKIKEELCDLYEILVFMLRREHRQRVEPVEQSWEWVTDYSVSISNIRDDGYGALSTVSEDPLFYTKRFSEFLPLYRLNAGYGDVPVDCPPPLGIHRQDFLRLDREKK